MSKNGKKTWTTVAEKVLLDRPPFVRVIQEEVEINNGHVIGDFYRTILPNFAVCVPFTTSGEVITAWQYKHGPKAYSLTFPGGFIDPGETPLETCLRELMEETGFQPGSVSSLGSFVDGGNQQGSTGHYFVATGCTRKKRREFNSLEEIDLKLMQPIEIEHALSNSHFAIGHHVIAWLLTCRFLKHSTSKNQINLKHPTQFKN